MSTLSSIPAATSHRPRGTPRPSRSSRRRAAALVLLHLAILAHIAHWKVAGTTLSPLEPSEAMQTLELGYVNAGFVLFVLLILATLVVGRFFCGWACHVVAYQDLSAWLLGKVGLRPRPLRSRLLVFVPLGAAFYMFVWPQVVRLFNQADLPPLVWHLTTDSFWATFPSPSIALLTFFVDGFLIVYLLGGKGFCTYGCPYGAVFGLADRVAPVRIRVTDACEQCGHCTAVCTSNVRVHEEVARHKMVVDSGCMKCLDCVSVCPKDALYVGVGKPAASPRTRPRRRFDFTWPEEIAAAAVFLVGLYAFRGLYGAVPFLLALGAAVITAAGALTLWRLLRQRELALQHHALKRAGRLRPAGVVTAVTIAIGLAFVGHSAFIQYHLREGERATANARDLPSSTRAAATADALDHLRTVERYGLVTDERTLNLLCGAHRMAGDYRRAAGYLERSVESSPTVAKLLDLSTLYMHQRDTTSARDALRRVLAIDPEHPQALERLRMLDQR